MTIIAALIHDGTIYMGADSAGVAGYDLTVRADRKVFTNGPYVIGFTSSFRMGQLLRWKLNDPDRDPRVDVEKFMCTAFVDAVRALMNENGCGHRMNNVDSCGNFLVGYAGRLFNIGGDYQVGENSEGFDAVGCGDNLALGALYATRGHPDPRERLLLALETAERFSAGVRGPFHIETLAVASVARAA